MKNTLLKHRIVAPVLLTLASAVALVCHKSTYSSSPLFKLEPHYLLSGTYETTSGYLDYYDIGNGEYGVALNDTFVPGNAIVILDEYNSKPVTGIMHNGFYKASASSITIPNGIKTIDFEAFLYSDIDTIIVPYTVNRIGDGAFYSSTVEHVTFVNSNAEDAGSACLCDVPPVLNESIVPSTLTKIPSFCFFNCKQLSTLSLPASIEEIGEEAFNGCSLLSSTLAFQSITTIREKAFQGCTSLRKIHISKSMFDVANGVGIEPHAFNYCADKSVLEFYFYGTNEKIDAWLANHANWGWYTDRGNPATDKYSIRERIDGSAYFTSDWTYTVSNNEVTITGYNGPAPTNGYISIPNHMPTPAGNRVTKIEASVFDEIKGSIERLYLPTTLVEIGNGMFKKGYDKLYVVDDNTACATDHANPPVTGRIDLSGLDDLKYIGSHAFAFRDTSVNPAVNYGIGTGTVPDTTTTYKELITKLYLPAHLIAIGDEAFGVFGQSMLPKVNDFRWKYDSESVLETIGTDCFFALGIAGANGDIKGNGKWQEHQSSTIIFPKTFRHFGMTSTDKTDYNNPNKYARTFNFNLGGETPLKGDRPAHAFEGCSLLKKVVFKGGADSNDLIIPLQTFVYNESLQTIIFEERPGKYIAFHTQMGAGSKDYYDYAQESIGGNSGRDKNDFRGEPFLQNLFLPNKTTTLYIQSFAFHANSRGKIYLSDEYGHNMYADATRYTWPEMTTGAYSWSTSYGVDHASNGAKQWRTIGNEEYYNAKHNAKYYGYCFAESASTKATIADSLNTFSLDQKMPYYENVHYEETIEEDYIESTDVEFGAGNPNELVIDDEAKCSFICKTDTTRPAGKQKVAIMTNYLFNIRDGSTSEQLRTCTIPKTVSVDDTDYTVIEIGESAFSDCFCDGQDTNPTVTVANVDNVRYIVMPDTIEKIGDYAFIRAYAVEKISSYETNPASATERMPKNLEHIGKNAFIFSGIKKVLKIPFACKFYENENNSNNKITSVFANALSLRKITFIDYDAATPTEQTYSDYYETTTYTPTGVSDTYTSALYSTNDAGLSYKKNRLLLILNRGKNDRKKESANHSGTKDCVEYGSPATGVTFNGLSKTNPFLYGAYKMGYWIKEIVWNNNTTPNGETDGTLYAQALFSPVGKYSSNNSANDFVDNYIFLGEVRPLYSSLACFLKSVTGITDITKLPKYGFDGCEQLDQISLPNQNAAVPDGVFANASSTVNYITVTPASPEGATSGYLDLTGTGYTKVGSESFKNNPSITHFVAPSNAFEVGTGAFQSCANLTDVDFSNVTGKLTINASAFASSGVTTITWPTDPNCKIIITNGSSVTTGAFSNCKGLTSISLPANLYRDASNKELGSYTFSSCTNLTTVTGTANSVDIVKIGDSAFNGCSKLDSFDFGIFTSSLTTIGTSAFQSCKTITNSGNISLPGNITTIGASAFKSSKIVTMTINSASISIGGNAFESCTNLTAFRFAPSAKTCTWAAYNTVVFNSCTSLTELQLPTTFELTRNFANTNFIKNDTNIKIYSYATYSGQTAHESWRKVANNQAKPVHYHVSSVSELLSGGVISDSDHSNIKNTIYFWTVNSSGEAVFLGKVKSYDGTTVIFQNDSGTQTYTLTGSTFSPAIP